MACKRISLACRPQLIYAILSSMHTYVYGISNLRAHGAQPSIFLNLPLSIHVSAQALTVTVVQATHQQPISGLLQLPCPAPLHHPTIAMHSTGHDCKHNWALGAGAGAPRLLRGGIPLNAFITAKGPSGLRLVCN